MIKPSGSASARAGAALELFRPLGNEIAEARQFEEIGKLQKVVEMISADAAAASGDDNDFVFYSKHGSCCEFHSDLI